MRIFPPIVSDCFGMLISKNNAWSSQQRAQYTAEMASLNNALLTVFIYCLSFLSLNIAQGGLHRQAS